MLSLVGAKLAREERTDTPAQGRPGAFASKLGSYGEKAAPDTPRKAGSVLSPASTVPAKESLGIGATSATAPRRRAQAAGPCHGETCALPRADAGLGAGDSRPLPIQRPRHSTRKSRRAGRHCHDAGLALIHFSERRPRVAVLKEVPCAEKICEAGRWDAGRLVLKLPERATVCR